MHQETVQDLQATKICAKELKVTRAAWLRYRGAMAGVVRSVGVTGTAVEDVVHDAFEMACRKPVSERPDPGDEARFLGWLCTLAKYAALTARNDGARCREISSPAEDLEDAVDSHTNYLGYFDDKVAAAVVFANLSAPDRALLHQHFYEDKTVKELADEQGVPWTTMRSRLNGVIDRARLIMGDRSYRRRGVAAIAFCWLTLHVRELQERLLAGWGPSKRMAMAGGLGFVLGGSMVASVPYWVGRSVASPVTMAQTSPLAAMVSKPIVTDMGHGAFPKETPQNLMTTPICPAGSGSKPSQESASLQQSSDKPKSTSAVAKKIEVKERSRVTLPWAVSADIRDGRPKGK